MPCRGSVFGMGSTIPYAASVGAILSWSDWWYSQPSGKVEGNRLVETNAKKGACMTNGNTPLMIKVWGDLACFTRPEMKVERVSYPVMTPSAARGVLEAVFWKPEFRWRVQEIWVLKPISYFSIIRNEMNHVQSERAARVWEREGGGYDASSTDEPKNRAQRHTLGLRDVAYVIAAHVDLKPHAAADPA